MDAVNEAVHCVGRLVTSDGNGSKTLDTSGSSAILWRTGAVTFSNAGTTFKVGLAGIDNANGPPLRLTNSSDVITFDVNASFTGGGGGVTANAYQTSVPTTGSKSGMAPGDLIGIGMQMTARGGTDSIIASMCSADNAQILPGVTIFTASYTGQTGVPNVLLTFSDGTYGWLEGSEIFSNISSVAYNSSSSPNEYGQLFQFPYPVRIVGATGVFNLTGNTRDIDVILYSAPISGSPVAERTVSIDANVTGSNAQRRFRVRFSSPYDVTANTAFGIVVKPTTTSSGTLVGKLIGNAAHRVADFWGTNSYGISRSGGSGTFANVTSSTQHYNIGLICSGFEVGGGSGSGASRARVWTGF